MTEYTVTGVRYTMGQGLSLDERSSLAKEFIKGIKIGTRVILEAEPDNPVDDQAIAVFVDYEIRGRIAKEQCPEVRQLFDENMQVDAIVSRTNEELAFFVTIPGAEEHKIQLPEMSRQLPESPLGMHVRMPFSNPEKALEMLGKKLTSMQLTKESISDFIEKAEHYEPLLDMSICYSDDQRISTVYDRLNLILDNKDDFEICEDNLLRVQTLREQLRDRVRSMHRRWDSGLEKAFINHLDCLRADTEITQYLFKSYCEAFLGAKSFEEADTDTMVKERERLQQWFKKMDWSELRDPRQLEKMAFKLSYLRVSRTEIYDVFGVLLLLEQLDERLPDVTPAAKPLSNKPSKPKKTVKKETVDKPMTLKYYKHGNNGVLVKQRKRVDIVFRKWTEWGWIDKNTSPDDFDAFFEGEPRHCNITWTGTTTILTKLVQELLQQPYIEKQKGCAAKSLVKQQFKKTANFDWSRIDKGIEDKIQISVIVLDINNPLPNRPERHRQEEVDIRDAALQEIYSGLLRSTKGI